MIGLNTSQEKIGQQAAGFWETGPPPHGGRYLCVYEGPHGKEAAVLDYVLDEKTRDYGWKTGSLDVEIVRWAEVNV